MKNFGADVPEKIIDNATKYLENNF